MQDMLYSGSVSSIKDLIAASDFSGDAFVLTESFPQHIIADDMRQGLLRFDLRKDVDYDLNSTISGRVFDHGGELRWERKNNSYQVVYLGKERKLPGLEPDRDNIMQGLEKTKERHYYLFGEVLEPEDLNKMGLEDKSGCYAEVRIPRLLEYPINSPEPKKKPRVQLVVQEYANQATGQIELFRFQNVEDAE